MAAEQQLERSVLERKEREELRAIAEAMALDTNSRSKKADIIDQILRAAGVDAAGADSTNGATTPARPDPAPAVPARRPVSRLSYRWPTRLRLTATALTTPRPTGRPPSRQPATGNPTHRQRRPGPTRHPRRRPNLPADPKGRRSRSRIARPRAVKRLRARVVPVKAARAPSNRSTPRPAVIPTIRPTGVDAVGAVVNGPVRAAPPAVVAAVNGNCKVAVRKRSTRASSSPLAVCSIFVTKGTASCGLTVISPAPVTCMYQSARRDVSLCVKGTTSKEPAVRRHPTRSSPPSSGSTRCRACLPTTLATGLDSRT